MFLNQKLNIPVLIVNPNIKISTKEVFSQVNQDNIIEKKISNMTNAIFNKNFDLISRELHNSLEEITFKMNPEIRKLKNHIIDMGIPGTLMSGSGSTIFAIETKKSKLQYSYETLRDDYYKIITKIR